MQLIGRFQNPFNSRTLITPQYGQKLYDPVFYLELILKSVESESNDVVYEFEENFRTMDPPSDSGDGGSDSGGFSN